MTGFLSNHSNYSWELIHGADIFTYEIYDSDGNPVRPEETTMRYINDIGYHYVIESNEKYRTTGEEQRSTEFYEFVITEPGNYNIKAKANFRVMNKDK